MAKKRYKPEEIVGLWLNDGSCIRQRAERADHVRSYDFVDRRTHDGRAFRTLNILDEFIRESLAIRVRRKLSSTDVIDVLTDLFILRGVPAYIRSDNGPAFVAGTVRGWIAAVGARTAFIAPGPPWENGYIESFNARLRDELLRHFLAAPLQPHPPTQQPGIPAAGPGNDRRAKLAARLRCAPPTIQLGGETVNALTFEPDQSPGAGHTRSSEKEHPWRLLRIPMSFRALWQGSRVSCASSGIYFS